MKLKLIFLLFFLPFLLLAQPRDSNPIGSKAGKCYAKCLIGNQFEYWEASFPVYLGNYEDTHKYLEDIEVIIQDKNTKWVKQKIDKNCKSIDPNDCFEWVLEGFPHETEVITIVTDTSKTVDYEWETFTYRELVEEGGFTEWREVVCNYKVTAELNRQIQMALKEMGYDTGSTITNKIGPTAKSALVKFQKDNGLPVGNLNLETLDALSIKY